MKTLDTIQCPYCVEGNGFKIMSERASGGWFLCDHCAHVVIPDQPAYECNCEKCVALLGAKPLSSHTKS